MTANTMAPAARLKMICLIGAYLTFLVTSSVGAAAQAGGGDTRYSVAYVEVQSSAVATLRAAFARYRDASRVEGGFVDSELLQQTGNLGSFVIVERWRDQVGIDAHAKADSTKRFRDAIEPIRVSGYDERPYKDFVVGKAGNASGEAVSVVTHVDTGPAADATELLRQQADASRVEPGCLRFDILQHAERPNHFTIIEAWRTRAARDRHVAAARTRQYRDALQPMLGSPLDERLMRLP